MPPGKNIYNLSIIDYVKTIFNVIISPKKTFSELNLSYYQLISYLIVSGWLYAIIACLLKSLSPFWLLLFSPISIVIHTFLISLFLYLIFNKLLKSKASFAECFKIMSYILIAMLPFMSIVFIKNRDTLILLMIKSFPFIYFLILTYIASLINFKNIKYHKLIQGNVLASMSTFFISTIIFTINMILLTISSKLLFDFTYIWKIYYN